MPHDAVADRELPLIVSLQEIMFRVNEEAPGCWRYGRGQDRKLAERTPGGCRACSKKQCWGRKDQVISSSKPSRVTMKFFSFMSSIQTCVWTPKGLNSLLLTVLPAVVYMILISTLAGLPQKTFHLALTFLFLNTSN